MIGPGPEKRRDSFKQWCGLKRIRLAVVGFIAFNALALLLVNSVSRYKNTDASGSGFCKTCPEGNSRNYDVTKDIFHLPLHQNAAMNWYYFSVKNDWCFRLGTLREETEKAGHCICDLNFHGKDCGIPEVVWKSSFLESGNKQGAWVRRRNKPRRLVSVLSVDSVSQFDFLRLQLDYLGGVVDAFVIGYTGERDLLKKIKRTFGESAVYRKLVYVQLRGLNPDKAVEELADVVWKRVSDYRLDDLFIWNNLTAVPLAEVLNFMKLYDGFSEPVRLQLRQLAYSFLWKPKANKRKDPSSSHDSPFITSFAMNSLLCHYDSKCVMSGRAPEFPQSVLETFVKNNGWAVRSWTLGNRDLPSGWDCRNCLSVPDSAAVFSEQDDNNGSSVTQAWLPVLKKMLKEHGFHRSGVQLVGGRNAAYLAPKFLLDKPGSLWYFVPFALEDAKDW